MCDSICDFIFVGNIIFHGPSVGVHHACISVVYSTLHKSYYFYVFSVQGGSKGFCHCNYQLINTALSSIRSFMITQLENNKGPLLYLSV